MASTLAPQLRPVYNELTHIRHQLQGTHRRSMEKTQVVMPAELSPVFVRLYELDHQMMDATRGDQQMDGTQLVDRLLTRCYELTWRLAEPAVRCDEAFQPLLIRLRGIRDGLLDLKRSGEYTEKDVRHFQRQLHEIESKREDGKFKVQGQAMMIAEGQAVLHTLLNDCYRLAHELLVATESVDPRLQPIRTKLVQYNHELDTMLKSGRTTHGKPAVLQQLRAIQQNLDKIDRNRRSGGFLIDPDVPGEATCMLLMDNAYDKIGRLVSLCEDVDETLMPIRVKLERIHDTLAGYQESGLYSQQELMHEREKLVELEKTRTDAAFKDEATHAVPKGQAIVNYLLAECHDLAEALANGLEGAGAVNGSE